MENKPQKLRPPTEEELKEMIRGIIQENHDHPILKPIRAKCNDCVHRIPRTGKCSLLYLQGIPKEILLNQAECPEFKQK